VRLPVDIVIVDRADARCIRSPKRSSWPIRCWISNTNTTPRLSTLSARIVSPFLSRSFPFPLSLLFDTFIPSRKGIETFSTFLLPRFRLRAQFCREIPAGVLWGTRGSEIGERIKLARETRLPLLYASKDSIDLADLARWSFFLLRWFPSSRIFLRTNVRVRVLFTAWRLSKSFKCSSKLLYDWANTSNMFGIFYDKVICLMD